MGDRLFDTSTRRPAHSSATVAATSSPTPSGSSRKLPHRLVDAFASTLEETALADLVLHVVDDSQPEDQPLGCDGGRRNVLEQIGAGDMPRLLVSTSSTCSTPRAAVTLVG